MTDAEVTMRSAPGSVPGVVRVAAYASIYATNDGWLNRHESFLKTSISGAVYA